MSDDCYDGLASGGYIRPDDTVIVVEGCDYIIPRAFAERWRNEILDKLNEDVLE